MKNEVVVKSQAVSLRNLENHIGQFVTALSNKTQSSLPSNMEDPKRERKEHFKVLNLRLGKYVHILVGVPKRRGKLVSTQEETQVEEESQHPTFQPTSLNNQVIIAAENNNPAPVGEVITVPSTLVQNMTKEKQFVQPAAP